MMIAAKKETVFTQNRLNREIKRNVKQLLLGFGPDDPHQSYIVLNVFKNVEH